MPGMQDHELYRRILGIEAPWFVDAVDLKLEASEIHVYLRHHEVIKRSCTLSHHVVSAWSTERR